jgi:hypothetical protein
MTCYFHPKTPGKPVPLYKQDPQLSVLHGILMPVSATLVSQRLLRPSPKSCSPCVTFSADEGGVAVPQGILTAFSAGSVLWFAGDTQWSWGEGGMVTSSGCLYIRASGRTLMAWSLAGEEASKVLGSGLSLYTWAVTAPLLLLALPP